MTRTVDVVSLLPRGPQPYAEVLELQGAAASRVREGGRETLFLLEHRPVITVGRNASLSDLHVLPDRLARIGVDLVQVDRGGKLTFHGPGQLVAYPVLDLAPGMTDVRRYVRALEEVLVLTAGDFGVEAARSDVPERLSSVWAGNDKLAAIGVHISRWVTTHGVAMNVSTDLSRFELFVPCGIREGGVTSLERILAPRPAPPLSDVAERFTARFAEIFSRSVAPASPPRPQAATG